jgi:hypothetical protein
MQPENPDNREPDTEFLSVQMKKKDGIPLEDREEGTKPPQSDEEVKEMASEAKDLDSLMESINGMKVSSVQDIYRIKELLIQFENKRLYEDM